MNNIYVYEKLKEFLLEDIGTGDITTENLDINKKVIGYFVAKEDGVLAGINFAIEIFKILEKDTKKTKFILETLSYK